MRYFTYRPFQKIFALIIMLLSGITASRAQCSAPTALSATAVTSNSATISWTAAAGSTGYEWVIDQTSAAPTGYGTFESATSVALTSLIASTPYYYHVRNNCGSGYSAWVTATFTTLAGSSTCVAPNSISIFAVTNNGATITWSGPTGAIGYEYVINTSSATPTGSGTATTGTFLNPNTLNPSTTYYLHMRTKCSSTTFSSWTLDFFTTTAPVCNAPASISASSITATTATISWPAASGVTTYEYAIGTSSALPTSGTQTSSLSTGVAGLTAGNTYYAFVRSVCGNNNYSSWMYAPFTTTGTSTCATPTSLTASGITSSSATFNWSVVSSAIGYEYVLDFSAGTPLSAGTAVSTNTFTLTGIAPSTTFYFHVRTQCTATSFSAWTDIPFTTLSAAACAAPTALTATAITNTSATLSWAAATGVTSYEYVVNTTAASPTGAGTSTPGTIANITGLTAATSYYLHVRSNCSGGSFSAWALASFTTTGTTACNAPTGITATNITANSAAIHWAAASGAIGYEYVVNTSTANPISAGTVVTPLSANVTGLSANTTYYVHLRSKCSSTTFSTWALSSSFSTSATGIDNVISSAVTLFAQPNPVKHIVTVLCPGQRSAYAVVSVTDLIGRVLHSQPVQSEKAVIDLSSFAPGMYFVTYSDGGRRGAIRIVKD